LKVKDLATLLAVVALVALVALSALVALVAKGTVILEPANVSLTLRPI
jgi:hypothetical protein